MAVKERTVLWSPGKHWITFHFLPHLFALDTVCYLSPRCCYLWLKTWTQKTYFVISAEKMEENNIWRHWAISVLHIISLRQHNTYFLNASFEKCHIFNILHYLYLLNCFNTLKFKLRLIVLTSAFNFYISFHLK